MTPSKQADSRVLLGVIIASHGVRGQVKLRSFTQNPEDILDYLPLYDEKGAVLDLQCVGEAKGCLIIAIKGVNDRNKADTLKGTQLFADKDKLPTLDEDEFYIEELVGLTVTTTDGTHEGIIKAAHNFGAGDMLEITHTAGNDEMYMFTKETFPLVDLARGIVHFSAPIIEETGETPESLPTKKQPKK